MYIAESREEKTRAEERERNGGGRGCKGPHDSVLYIYISQVQYQLKLSLHEVD